MQKLTILLIVLLAGCAADQKDIKQVADTKSVALAKPSKPLSSFASYQLRPITLSKHIEVDEAKTRHLAILEKKVREKLSPLFTEWKASGVGARSGTLIVAPELTQFRIVSGAARFWAGALAGQSRVDMTLRLIDGATKKVIAEPTIDQASGAWAGAWSIGTSDTNLHDYMAGIAHQYMVANY
jgi:hypothetical protein